MVLVARSLESLEGLRSSILEKGQTAEVRACDVGDSEALSGLVEEVASTHGRLDVLVNNAGITRDGLILRMSDEDFDQVITVNLKAAFVSCRAAIRPMMRGKFGRIVNVGSVTGIMGNSGQANYAAAKAGLIGLTKTIAKEVGAKGITANVVAPGFIDTDMTSGLPETLKTEVCKTLPTRRFGQPEEIAHAVSYVASDLAGYMTGQVLVVDGGLVA